MPNPADIMKLLGMKNKFTAAHPKFVAFLSDIAKRGIAEGEIIEVSIIGADGARTTANLKVTAEDVEMVRDLKNLK